MDRTTPKPGPDTPMPKHLTEGWHVPRGSWGWKHYFRDGSSLCGRWNLRTLIWEAGRLKGRPCRRCREVIDREAAARARRAS